PGTTLWSKRASETPPSHAANLALRLLQVHFAIVVVTSGLHKLQFGEWWSGGAFWYPLHPPFETTAESLARERENARTFLSVLGIGAYALMAWQVTFPFFAWRRGWCRWLLVGGAVIGWIGSFFLYRLPLFGPIYFIACMSYLTSKEWHGLLAWLSQL